MSELLSAAELGDVGEDLFQHLCSQARLTCNKSHRDRHGWDFRVEFRDDATSRAPLDRQLPRVCMVQVKATADVNGARVAARLSSINRLAKDNGPAAIVILRLRPDGVAQVGYVIHLIDDELARVLRRLRRAEAEGRADINHMTISFDYRKARRFKPNPAGLREALAEICTEDVAAYTAKKQHQLARLGYEEAGEVEAEVLVRIEDKDHLTRILSGITPLRLLQMQTYDRRFGIRLPYRGGLLEGIEEFPIQLPAAGPCDIVIRNGPRRPAALFRCEAFVPPPIEGAPLMVIKHPALVAVFKNDGLDIQTVGNFSDGRRSLDDWILILRGLSYIASGNGTLELEFRGIRLSPMPVPAEKLDGPYLEELPRLFDFVERWSKALSLAGLAPAGDFALDDVWEARTVQVALDMLFNPAPVAKIELDLVEGAEGETRLEAMYFNTVEFAGAKVAFAVQVSFVRQGVGSNGFASTHFELLDIRPGVTDLKAYGTQRASDAQLTIVFDPESIVFFNPDTPAHAQG